MGVSPQRHGRGHVRRGTAKISRFPLRTGLRTHYTDCPHAALSSDLRRSRVVGTSFLSFLPDPHPMTNPHIPAGAAFRTRCSFSPPSAYSRCHSAPKPRLPSPPRRWRPRSQGRRHPALRLRGAHGPRSRLSGRQRRLRWPDRHAAQPHARGDVRLYEGIFGGLERHRYARIVPLRDERRSG